MTSKLESLAIYQPPASKLFVNDYDQQYYQSVCNAITASSLTKTEYVPPEIVRNIGEFAAGFHVNCDNFKYCHNKTLPFDDASQLMNKELYKHDWDQIYEDALDGIGEGQISVLKREAMKYVKQFGYFYIKGFGDNHIEQYFCADCIKENGISMGLEHCSKCEINLTIFNYIPLCECEHYLIYCNECWMDKSCYCNICNVAKCHESDVMRATQDRPPCHQKFECDECGITRCGRGGSLDDLKKKCKECITEICTECSVEVCCDGCGKIKCWTHETCYKYEEKVKCAFEKCDNPTCNYNNMKNGPLYKMWFGSK